MIMSEILKGYYREKEAQMLQESCGVWASESTGTHKTVGGKNFWEGSGLAKGKG